MNHKKVIAIISVILIFSIAILFISALIIHPNENKPKRAEYLLKLRPLDQSGYQLIVPVLIEETGGISPIMNAIKIEGNGSGQILNSTYGLALSITGTGPLKISSFSSNAMPSAFFNLVENATGGGNVRYWIYYNSSQDNSATIEILGGIYDSRNAYVSYISKPILSNDWQKVDGTRGIIKP